LWGAIVFVSQNKYASDIFKKFKIENSKSVFTPFEKKMKLTREIDDKRVDPTYYKSFIESFEYLTVTRPNIVFGVRFFSADLWKRHECVICDGGFYANNSKVKLVEYIDSDWTGDVEKNKKKKHRDMYFILVVIQYHDLQINNQLFYSQSLK